MIRQEFADKDQKEEEVILRGVGVRDRGQRASSFTKVKRPPAVSPAQQKRAYAGCREPRVCLITDS